MSRRLALCGKIIAVVCGLGLSAAGCIEMDLDVQLRLDGSGTLKARYVVIDDLVHGRFAQVGKNNLLPLTEEEIVPWAARIAGVRIVATHSEAYKPDNPDSALEQGYHVIEFTAEFNDVEAFSSNHVKFAYYPYGGHRYFQLYVAKNVPEFGSTITDPNAVVNVMAQSVAKDRHITLHLNVPAKILRNNANSVEWASATWKIPLAAIVATAQPQVVAWAEMPPSPGDGWRGAVMPLWYALAGEHWRDPRGLPDYLVAPGGPS